MLRRKLTILAALSATAVLGMSGCGTSTNVSWQDNGTPYHQHPSQTWWNYKYVYYPQAQVYFEPYSHTWFWFEDDLWHQGDQLPQEITVYDQTPHVVKLASLPPYEQHETVAAAHGPFLYAYPGSLSPDYAPNAAYAKAFAKRRAIGQAIDEFKSRKTPPKSQTARAFTHTTDKAQRPFRQVRKRADVRAITMDQPRNTKAYATAESTDAGGY